MSNEQVIIELVLEKGNVANGLKKVVTEFSKSGKDSGKKFSKGIGQTDIFAKLKKSLFSFKSAIAGVATSLAAAFAGRKLIQAANVQEDAVNRLNSSLLITGKLTDQTSKEIQDFASSLQKSSRFGDEAILSNAALIQSLGNLDKNGLKQATAAAVDLAAALKVDLGTAATLVGKAAAGEVGSFSRLGLSVKKAENNTKTFANALDAINTKFGGAAALDVNTYSGAVDQASMSFGDLLEELGFFITKNPLIKKSIIDSNKGINDLSESIKKFRDEGGIEKITMSIIEVGSSVNTFVVAPIELAVNVIKLLFSGINNFFAGIVAGIGQSLGLIGDALSKLGVFDTIAEKLQTFRESSLEVFNEALADTSSKLDGIFSFERAAQAQEYLDNLKASYQDAAASINTSTGKIVKDNAKVTKDLKANAQVQQAVAQGLTRIVSLSFQELGATLVGAGNGFKAFLGVVVNALGDLAISIGTTVVAAAIAIDSLKKSVFGTGAIGVVAGLALITIGGALKAFGSTFGGGGASPPPAPSSGVPSGTGGDFFEDNQFDQETVERTEPRSSLVINVQGDIVSEDEFGTRLVDIINKSIDNTDVKLRGMA